MTTPPSGLLPFEFSNSCFEAFAQQKPQELTGTRQKKLNQCFAGRYVHILPNVSDRFHPLGRMDIR